MTVKQTDKPCFLMVMYDDYCITKITVNIKLKHAVLMNFIGKENTHLIPPMHVLNTIVTDYKEKAVF